MAVGLGALAHVTHLGHAKVGQLDVIITRQKDVAGLDVTMDDILLPGYGNSLAHLDADLDHALWRQLAVSLDQVPERAALDEFFDQVLVIVLMHQIVDGDDVRVLKSSLHPALQPEPFQILGILLGLARLALPRQLLDRYGSLQLGVPGPVHLAKAPLTNDGLNLVAPHTITRLQHDQITSVPSPPTRPPRGHRAAAVHTGQRD